MAAVTLLAASLLIVSLVLGIRAGQRQLELSQRQQVGIVLAQAIGLQSSGNSAAAIAAYKQVLALDPANTSAQEALQTLLPPANAAPAPAVADGGQPAVAPITVTSALAGDGGATIIRKNPVAPVVVLDGAQLFQEAETAYNAGRLQQAIEKLAILQRDLPSYQPEQIAEMLFQAYVNLAYEKDNQDKLEEALTLFDQALRLHPQDATILKERGLVSQYLAALTHYGANWIAAVQLLEAIYAEEPTYRDVKQLLHTALLEYGNALGESASWCDALSQYDQAAKLENEADLIAKREEAQKLCTQRGAGVAPAEATANLTATLVASPTLNSAKGAATPSPTPTQTAVSQPVAGSPSRGRILYSARDSTSGRTNIWLQAVQGAAAPILLREDGNQPALRADGQRLAFHNLANDSGGISTWDPSSALLIRLTQFPEDNLPSWSPQGNQVVFASNREGDRRWRIYVTWAQADVEATFLDFGESPSWHPSGDLLVYRGCDSSGNGCALWTMNSAGGNRTPLTTIPADNRPAWSPDGRYVLFMSDGRDGNMELYRAEVASKQVIRLTNDPGLDVLPAVSPDGAWVAFLSNRDGAWKLWAVPINGGSATVLAPIPGDIGNWPEQSIQWVN